MHVVSCLSAFKVCYVGPKWLFHAAVPVLLIIFQCKINNIKLYTNIFLSSSQTNKYFPTILFQQLATRLALIVLAVHFFFLKILLNSFKKNFQSTNLYTHMYKPVCQ